MQINLDKDQQKIIKIALSDAIEKYIGVSQAQEAFIHNIDKGMSMKEAQKKFNMDNRKEWEYYIHEEKSPFHCLYDYIFISPASFRG